MSQRLAREAQSQLNSEDARQPYNFWTSNVDMNPAGPAPTPPSTNNSNGASPEHGQFRVVRKRNRVPLSCAPCRHRKLKCNRGHPCDNCTKRGDVASCAYAAPSARKKTGHHGAANGGSDDMQNRIDRLENLVLSLMTTEQGATVAHAQAAVNASAQSASNGSRDADVSMNQDESTMHDIGEDDSDVNDVSHAIGIMKVDGSKSFYASDAHWHAILANIAEVKNYYASHKDDYIAQIRRVKAAQEDNAPGGSYIFTAPRLVNREELLAEFPSREQADMLIARYFNSPDPSCNIVHLPTFKRMYDDYWINPMAAPVAFIAELYALMSMALQSYSRRGDEPAAYIGISMKMADTYRRLTAQALVLADITDQDPLTLEALVQHFCAETNKSGDVQAGTTTLLGIIVRKAMKMGYHRDPRPHPSITPFQAEMRRRVWAFVRLFDLLYSSQAGLPPVAHSDTIDTTSPSNYRDEDLFEDMQSLPPPRPDTEQTPIGYLICKAKLTQCFGLIIERLSVVTPPIGYEEVMALDSRLREARMNLAPQFRLRPLRDSERDEPTIIMQRYSLELMYLTSQCLLHRRFLSRGRESPRYAYSRQTCIDASMDMLSHQSTLHRESQPGGRLHSVKWYISSVTTNDFLIAAMIVCLELHYSSEHERSHKGSTASSPMSSDLIEGRKSEMLDAIRHSRSIWDSIRDRSVDAWKASTSIKIMLEKLEGPQQSQDGAAPGTQNYGSSSQRWSVSAFQGGFKGILANGNAPMNDIERDQGAEQAAAMTLGLLSSGGVSPGPQQLAQNGTAGVPTGTSSGLLDNSRPYSASMGGIMNEPSPDLRQNFAPLFSSIQQDAASPFNGMLAPSAPGIFEGANGFDIDWGAWDSFIQGSSMPNWSNVSGDSAVDPALESPGAQKDSNAFNAQRLKRLRTDGQVDGADVYSGTF